MAVIKNKIKKIGIFGGTFDPIHYGHLIAAQNALEILGLDRLIFVPAGKPPHKCSGKISPPVIRYKMVKLGILGNKYFAASDIELASDCASYTVESLRKIKKLFPSSELYLLIGLDQALALSTWRKPEEILKICKVVVMARPGYRTADVENKWKKKIVFLPVPLIEISASNIRERTFRGASIEYLVPARVRQYIQQQGLYKDK
ncbi:MAG: nicotinate-nucleotide adenylyltransferase [Candidatus Edwardsbacteria bacterium]|nr:nicotinate-nucleotide adenylyltransferase [Candidatus Edwardsbacteria bacterium]MBU1577331.1 nicotinate-nucleotide adenylyltransferase [Candidatus Edwardsbacteria bacterium]MBU2464304.1 nicotinate-nucleotide adenylyltransferase [Candidatus Edwardsbacteria bacterium]MBU2594932.1 nicotinate-nucleotide adenylyltransferase [Candidatus Edwardsbacteria bacterium]